MKTRSCRERYKEEGEGIEIAKRKATFKGIQIALSLLINTALFYVLNTYYLSSDILTRICQIFAIVFVSVFGSNFIALGILVSIYHVENTKHFLSMEDSYVKFFSVSLLYSFVSSLAFSFGIITLIYYTLGDGTTLTLILTYAIGYVFIEFFSYGFVTWLYGLGKTIQQGKGS